MTQFMPPTWRMVKLGACLQRRKDTVMPATLSDASVGLVGLEDIQDGGRGGITIRATKPEEIKSLKTRFVAGDILYGKLRPYLNKVGIVHEAGLCSTEIWVFGPSALVDSQYAAFFLASSFFVDRSSSLTKGANLPRLDVEAFDSIEIPLPPLSEQQRIAAVLQEAENIRRLRADAETKTAVLIPAMFFEHFEEGRGHGFRPLHELADVVSGVAIGRKGKGMMREVPYMRVANVQAGFIDLTEVKTTPATDEEVLQFGLKAGDILLTEGGDFDKLGRGCLWDGLVAPCIHQNHVFRVRPYPGKLNSRFFSHYLQSARAKHYFLRCAKKTTNLASINLNQLKALPVPNISIADQEFFEQQIQIAVECSAANGSQIFSSLTQSLSAYAFSGQLTVDWRQVHADKLATEAHERDTVLKQAGATIIRSRRATIQEEENVWKIPTDGVYADLNREQRDLLFQIGQRVGGVDYARYFTAEGLSNSIDGPLRRNPQAIEGHLAVLAARGLIILVSREEQTDDTGEFVFGNAYRLPRRDKVDHFTSEKSDRLDEKGNGLTTDEVPGDRARVRELARLAAQLEKERSLS